MDRKEFIHRIEYEAKMEMMTRFHNRVQTEFEEVQKELIKKEPEHKEFIQSLKCTLDIIVLSPK